MTLDAALFVALAMLANFGVNRYVQAGIDEVRTCEILEAIGCACPEPPPVRCVLAVAYTADDLNEAVAECGVRCN